MMDIDVNKNISLLDEVRMQALVLVPVIRALRAELGEQRANRIVSNALRDWSRSKIQSFGVEAKGCPREKWASVTATSMQRIGNDIDIEWIKQDANEIKLNVIGCRYADLFRQLGEPELGSVLLCETDVHVAELGAPEVEFTRTQTIMQGADYCDFHYRMKSEAETK
jgi:hypothetical protein